MAVLKMRRISICALKKDRKKILELLQKSEEDEVLKYRQAESAYREFVYNNYMQIPAEAEELLYGREDVYLDTSSTSRKLPSSEIKRIIRKHDSKKILFGTDYPIERHGEALEKFLALGLTDDETEDILYNNSYRLLYN